jgi:hypothetical protein
VALSSSDILASIAPEYASDARGDTFLELAALQMNATAWGARYPMGAAYLAAHMLTLADEDAEAGDGATAGAVTGKGAGDLSISYGGPSGGSVSATDALYMTTKYGREFLRLRGGLAARAARIIIPGV